MGIMFAIDQISGLPAHPLLVHIPVVLVPLTAVGAILIAIKASWRERFGIPLLAISFVGALGATLAADAGESLQEAGRGGDAIREHADAGSTARTLSVILFLLLAIVVLLPLVRAWLVKSGRKLPEIPQTLMVGLAVFTAVFSLVATWSMVDAGHSGAKSVWNGKTGTGGETGGGDDDGNGQAPVTTVVVIR